MKYIYPDKIYERNRTIVMRLTDNKKKLLGICLFCIWIDVLFLIHIL